jgi:hypothetical protein
LKIENFTFQIGRAALPGNLPIFSFHFSIFNSFPLVAATRPRCVLRGEPGLFFEIRIPGHVALGRGPSTHDVQTICALQYISYSATGRQDKAEESGTKANESAMKPEQNGKKVERKWRETGKKVERNCNPVRHDI